jgi:hypothetical protein
MQRYARKFKMTDNLRYINAIREIKKMDASVSLSTRRAFAHVALPSFPLPPTQTLSSPYFLLYHQMTTRHFCRLLTLSLCEATRARERRAAGERTRGESWGSTARSKWRCTRWVQAVARPQLPTPP